ncbi:MAG: hypothetical protein J3K34DRAFT_520806 [Monoraphidium minutum]|nr:MAG: hypothetical protein J3K34DRAFT_520806 [Monoraphidium minutum]
MEGALGAPDGRFETAIVWFRRDCRTYDAPALLAALGAARTVIPVFIWAVEEEGQFQPGRQTRWWFKQTVRHLAARLGQLGSRLVLRRAPDSASALRALAAETGAAAVFFNHLYDSISMVRDQQIKDELRCMGVAAHSFNADLLYEPWQVLDDDGQPYTTFKSYWDKCLAMPFPPPLPLPEPPAPLPAVPPHVASLGLDEVDWFMTSEQEASVEALVHRWDPSGAEAVRRLEAFLDMGLPSFEHDRAKTDRESTTMLSPWIHAGSVSVRHIYYRVAQKHAEWQASGAGRGASCLDFVQQLGYREYSRYLSFHFPFMTDRAMLAHLRAVPWRLDQRAFKAWRQGLTGYPLVDAGMRQLWSMGWCHNRVRVVAASFLVKHLLLPWQWGLKHLWDCQIDADLECDALGWQYVAGCLSDAHPFSYMIDLEQEWRRFDPDGQYVRRWLPVLSQLPAEYIHQPWRAPPEVLDAAGVELGFNYPWPIISGDAAREGVALAASVVERCYAQQQGAAAAGGGRRDAAGSKGAGGTGSGTGHGTGTAFAGDGAPTGGPRAGPSGSSGGSSTLTGGGGGAPAPAGAMARKEPYRPPTDPALMGAFLEAGREAGCWQAALPELHDVERAAAAALATGRDYDAMVIEGPLSGGGGAAGAPGHPFYVGGGLRGAAPPAPAASMSGSASAPPGGWGGAGSCGECEGEGGGGGGYEEGSETEETSTSGGGDARRAGAGFARGAHLGGDEEMSESRSGARGEGDGEEEWASGDDSEGSGGGAPPARLGGLGGGAPARHGGASLLTGESAMHGGGGGGAAAARREARLRRKVEAGGGGADGAAPAPAGPLPHAYPDPTYWLWAWFELHNALTSPQGDTQIMLANNITMTLESCPPGSGVFDIPGDILMTTTPGAPTAWFDCSFMPHRASLLNTLTFERIGVVNCHTDAVLGYIDVYNNGRLVFDRAIHHSTLCASFDSFLATALHAPRPGNGHGNQLAQQVGPGWCDTPEGAPIAQATGARAAGACGRAAVLMKDVSLSQPHVHKGGPQGTEDALVEITYRRGCGRSAVLMKDVSLSQPHVHKGGPQGAEDPLVEIIYRDSLLDSVLLDSVLLCSDPKGVMGGCQGDHVACVEEAFARIDPDAPYYAALAAQERAQRARVLGAALGATLGALALVLAAVGALLLRRVRRRAAWREVVNGTLGGGKPAYWGGAGDPEGGGGASSSGDSDLSAGGAAAKKHSGGGGSDATWPLMRPDGIQLGVLMGAGSTGRVYAGRWKGRLVAVKVLTHSSEDEPFIERELRLSMTFLHPHVTSALHYAKTRLAHPAEPTPGWAHYSHPASTSTSSTPLGGPPTPSPTAESPPRAAGGNLLLPAGAAGTSATASSAAPSPEPSAGPSDAPPSFSSGGGPFGGSGGRGGAVAVFSASDVPHDLSVAGARRVDMETWIVMELMDQGTLAGAVHAGRMLKPVPHGGDASAPRGVEWRAVLLRARDTAAGLAYLHSRGVVHADVKADNVLLKTDPQDPFMLQ